MTVIERIHAKSLGQYCFNEYTTEFGAIVFDDVKGGNISNCYLWRLGYKSYGHIDFYIDKRVGFIKSIWLVSLRSKILFQDNKLEFKRLEDYRIPIFDTSVWAKGNESDIWPKIECQNAIEVYHNGNDTLRLIFGTIHSNIQLNEELQLHINNKNIFSGITIFNVKNIPKLIDKLRN